MDDENPYRAPVEQGTEQPAGIQHALRRQRWEVALVVFAAVLATATCIALLQYLSR